MNKYVILKKLGSPKSNPFTELASAGSEPQLPFDLKSENLTDKQAKTERRDPTNLDVVLSIPFTLVEPFEDCTAADGAQVAWGIQAVAGHTDAQAAECVTVAVLDTGIDLAHPAFHGLLDFADCIDFSASDQGLLGQATDVHGHGTHVAGTLFGKDVTGTRIGIARKIKRALIAKVIGPTGASTEGILNAIQWALMRRADVISMSLVSCN